MSEPAQALIVDDDPIARKTVRFALEREGFQCDVAIDGNDASRHLENNVYALVVTDLRMPNKHGHALSLELLAKHPRPIVVVHSSVDDPRLTKDLILRGVDDIIYKPTNYAAFAAKMNAMVRRQREGLMNASPRRLDAVQTEDPIIAEAIDADEGLISEVSSSIPASSPVPLSDINEKLPLVLRIMPVSKAALDVYEMTRAGCDAAKLGDAIRRDAALAAEVLSIANSNFYNPTGKAVTELGKAVVRIGQRRTGELALAASTLSGMTTRQFSWMDMRTMWRQSIAAGVAVELLVAQGKHGKLGDNLALIAIMHSLGRVVLGTLYPNHYRQLVKQCDERGESLIEQEQHIFPENHAKIMTRLLALWNIPEDIYRPMGYILDSYSSLNRLANQMQTKAELVKLAVFVGQVATRAWHTWDLVEVPPASLLRRLQIHDIAAILEQTRKNTQTIIDFQSDEASDQGKNAAPQKVEDTGRNVFYGNVSTLPFDFIAQLIQDTGLKVVPLSPDTMPPAPKVLINSIGGAKNDPPSEFTLSGEIESVVLTDGDGSADERMSGEILELPITYGKLRSAFMNISASEADMRRPLTGTAM